MTLLGNGVGGWDIGDLLGLVSERTVILGVLDEWVCREIEHADEQRCASH
ncbi:MAG TPA: hypothetical protein VNW73_15845 [Ktedonobacteraceae bacterium]|nr:hypothetical protein [Ktedonobacteraceae bacterium]